MFGRKDKGSARDFRASPRKGGRGFKAFVDGAECDLLDYSDGGARIRFEGSLRRVAVIEIFRDRRRIRRCPAVLAWRRGDQAGYAFSARLGIKEFEVPEDRPPEPEPKEPRTNSTGGVAGSALRNRLGL